MMSASMGLVISTGGGELFGLVCLGKGGRGERKKGEDRGRGEKEPLGRCLGSQVGWYQDEVAATRVKQ